MMSIIIQVMVYKFIKDGDDLKRVACIYIIEEKGSNVMNKEPNDENENVCYFGSTVDFEGRYYDHKKTCDGENYTGYNFPIYKYIREHGGWDNFEMKLICYVHEEDKTTVEQMYMDKYKSTLNVVRST